MPRPSIETARGWQKKTMVDRDGAPLGHIVHIYLDQVTGEPEWALLATGQGGQQALTRSEEELEVDTKQVPRGQAGVRKRVVTEQQHRTVPVEREELRVQREPIPAGEGDRDAEVAADERTIELREEQPVVDKRVVPKERVRIDKEVVRDQEHVSEPVRKEQVEVEQPDGER